MVNILAAFLCLVGALVCSLFAFVWGFGLEMQSWFWFLVMWFGNLAFAILARELTKNVK